MLPPSSPSATTQTLLNPHRLSLLLERHPPTPFPSQILARIIREAGELDAGVPHVLADERPARASTMSDLTSMPVRTIFSVRNEDCRETPRVAAWRDQDPSVFQRGRVRAGFLLRELQRGELLALPDSRPMPGIGPASHELRVPGGNTDWRIFYAIRPDAIVILGVEKKGSQRTPKATISACRQRLRAWDRE